MTKPSILRRRNFLKSDDWSRFATLGTDQRRGLPGPPVELSAPEGAHQVDLIPPDAFTIGRMPLIEAIARRRSRRNFSPDALTLEELSFLLWATQGIRHIAAPFRAFRTVPSAGCRHPFETYLLVNRVVSLAPGLYRYLPVEHRLCLLKTDEAMAADIHAASGNQYVLDSAATFIWTAVPYRTEWRYLRHAHRVILLDAGHVCQNLYLACEAIGCGTCAIAAYDQGRMDAVLGVNGEDEFTIYMAPVGRFPELH
jgi:SagB-type dehydrogenase family enzyme